ncbi:MAG: DUF4268 domain-containing protein [Mesonia hippocampi]|uniref:DUF4268 domain-containing protein n=1 Tax=Mesonia hippocampi TaxID=1628250 RepID=UPI003F94461A
MFSKEESKKIRQEFWTNFGKRSSRKWMLYDTKIKEVNLKFHFDTKKAQVGFVIDTNDELIKAFYFENFLSLKNLLKEEVSKELIFHDCFETESGKLIGFIYIELPNVCIHNKKTWDDVYLFFENTMPKFEAFFITYKDVIKG